LLAGCLCALATRAVTAEEWPRLPGALKVADPGTALVAPPDNMPAESAVELPAAVAHGPSPATLPEFVDLAMRSHPKLRQALAAVEAARGKAVQARLYPNPVIAGFTPQAAGSDSQWSGTVAQDIVTAGKLRLSQQAALREVQKSEYQLIRARFDVLKEVRQSFYALLVSQRRMEIYKLLLDIAKRSYEIGRQLAEAGEGGAGAPAGRVDRARRVPVCRSCGDGSHVVPVALPYVFRYLANELAAMGVRIASRWWVALVIVQIALGAWTIWSNKAADITTAHVAVGALILFLGVAQCFLLGTFSPRAAELKREKENLVPA
jgi:hypothetical protein